jgi:hypothetical protein
MLASSHDGERASAALLATEQLKKLGHTWHSFVEQAFAPSVRATPEPTPRPAEPRRYGARGYDNPRHENYCGLNCFEVMGVLQDMDLAPSDRKYLDSLALQMRGPQRGLTLRQWEILADKARRYGVLKKSA